MHATDTAELPSIVSAALHIFVAFDWGDEIDLAKAAALAPAELKTLARRSRTPASVAYRPAPLRFRLGTVSLEFGAGAKSPIETMAECTVFDFGAVSLAMRVPLDLSPADLRQLAGSLSEPDPIVQAARGALGPLFDRLRPAIDDASWSELSEEYFVFQFTPHASLPNPAVLVDRHASWVAGLVRLEDETLSEAEIAEALRLHLSYTPDDLFVAEWSAAVLIDQSCDETLQTIEFANLQLLEFRYLDARLDQQLASAYKHIHPPHRRWMPFLTRIGKRLRQLGELRIEAHSIYERTGDALKLVGDQYLARVYQMLSTRFHLAEWQRGIERSLSVLEGAYQVLSDESDTNRSETLEWIVILLIAFEVVMALVR
ncbi:MAG TPA: hypothetical protein VHV77_16145 [Pirellulales bacterium]|jgi:hypothetical protein|nr:hypothetical protein [Pirellulales bacterium]